MKKIIVMLLMVVLLTSCGVKEGFTTFGALQNKIEDYLINIDVSDATLHEFKDESLEYGLLKVSYYSQDDKTIYMNIIQGETEDNLIDVYYIDESLVYITEINDINDDVLEYIILDGQLAVFNTVDEVLEELEIDNEVALLVKYIESQI